MLNVRTMLLGILCVLFGAFITLSIISTGIGQTPPDATSSKPSTITVENWTKQYDTTTVGYFNDYSRDTCIRKANKQGDVNYKN